MRRAWDGRGTARGEEHGTGVEGVLDRRGTGVGVGWSGRCGRQIWRIASSSFGLAVRKTREPLFLLILCSSRYCNGASRGTFTDCWHVVGLLALDVAHLIVSLRPLLRGRRLGGEFRVSVRMRDEHMHHERSVHSIYQRLHSKCARRARDCARARRSVVFGRPEWSGIEGLEAAPPVVLQQGACSEFRKGRGVAQL